MMFSLSPRMTLLIICLYYFYMYVSVHAEHEYQFNGMNNTGYDRLFRIDPPSIPLHNDTSRDKEGEDHDSEPLRNNGRGSHEARLQNFAAENNVTHGMPVENFQEMMLEEHNKYRQRTCAPDLLNDNDLHEKAQKRANDKANGNDTLLPDDYNENADEYDTGDPSKVTAEIIVKTWYDEGQHYIVANESSAKHYSQLVWKNSTKLGIGHAYNGQKLFIVVLYKPAGNIPGQFDRNVGCYSQAK